MIGQTVRFFHRYTVKKSELPCLLVRAEHANCCLGIIKMTLESFIFPFGVAWKNLVWPGKICCGLETHGVACKYLVWSGNICCGLEILGVAWKYLVWPGNTCCGLETLGVAWKYLVWPV